MFMVKKKKVYKACSLCDYLVIMNDMSRKVNKVSWLWTLEIQYLLKKFIDIWSDKAFIYYVVFSI